MSTFVQANMLRFNKNKRRTKTIAEDVNLNKFMNKKEILKHKNKVLATIEDRDKTIKQADVFKMK